MQILLRNQFTWNVCQSLFFKKNITNLSSAEFVQRVVKVTAGFHYDLALFLSPPEQKLLNNGQPRKSMKILRALMLHYKNILGEVAFILNTSQLMVLQWVNLWHTLGWNMGMPQEKGVFVAYAYIVNMVKYCRAIHSPPHHNPSLTVQELCLQLFVLVMHILWVEVY